MEEEPRRCFEPTHLNSMVASCQTMWRSDEDEPSTSVEIDAMTTVHTPMPDAVMMGVRRKERI
jgi:hypothetical protein